MSCPILTPDRLEQLLAGTLTTADREAIRQHFEDPCEGCLDLLDGVDGERLLQELAGDAALLSNTEADRMFEAIAPKEKKASFWQRLFAPQWRPAMALAFAVLLAVPLYTYFSRTPYEGVKGDDKESLTVTQILLVGTRHGDKPKVLRRAKEGERLKANELLLWRYRISQAAHVCLLVEGKKRERLWCSKEKRPAGEHEIAAEGMVLALDPTPYGERVQFMVVASPEGSPESCSACVRDRVMVVTGAGP